MEVKVWRSFCTWHMPHTLSTTGTFTTLPVSPKAGNACWSGKRVTAGSTFTLVLHHHVPKQTLAIVSLPNTELSTVHMYWPKTAQMHMTVLPTRTVNWMHLSDVPFSYRCKEPPMPVVSMLLRNLLMETPLWRERTNITVRVSCRPIAGVGSQGGRPTAWSSYDRLQHVKMILSFDDV